jgi:small subunit ribosomal protein S20
MANLKSSKKDLKRNEKRRIRNQSVKSALKTYVKKVRQAAATGDAAAIDTNVVIAVKNIDKAAQRGVIHKNAAARRKSRVMKAANAAKKAQSA